jgi:hypothetical protein
MSLRTGRAGTDAPAIEAPVPPFTTLHLHLSARVCGIAEFSDAHGVDAISSFQPLRIAGGLTPSASTARLGGGALLTAAVHARTPSDPATAGAVHAAAAGVTKERAVMADVLSSLMAELVRDGAVDEAFDGLAPGSVPLFSQLVAGVSAGEVGGAGATAAASASSPAGGVRADSSAITADNRVRLLLASEFQELCSRLVENTVLNLAREACHGEFDVCKPPVTVVRL